MESVGLWAQVQDGAALIGVRVAFAASSNLAFATLKIGVGFSSLQCTSQVHMKGSKNGISKCEGRASGQTVGILKGKASL